MTKITSNEVEAVLPDGYDAFNDGPRAVHLHAPGGPDPSDVAGSGTIEPADGRLWRAVWSEYNPARGFHDPVDSVTGTKERCIQWIAKKARGETND